MLKQLRANHPFLYCIFAIALFLAAMKAGAVLLTAALLAVGEPVITPFRIEDYLLQAAGELFGVAAALAPLWLTGRLWVLRQRGCGFLDGLLAAMFPLTFLGVNLGLNLAALGGDGQTVKAPWRIAVFVLAMFLVGLAEELLFRGAIAQTMLEHFGAGRAGIWKACILSGVLFGASHLINLLSSAPLGVLIQSTVAASMGMLYAAIYFRTGNLWVLIFVHTLQDVNALLASGVCEGGATVSEVVSGYDPSMLMGALIYLLPTLFLLRKKRIPVVAAFWRMEEQPPAAPASPAP